MQVYEFVWIGRMLCESVQIHCMQCGAPLYTMGVPYVNIGVPSINIGVPSINIGGSLALRRYLCAYWGLRVAGGCAPPVRRSGNLWG